MNRIAKAMLPVAALLLAATALAATANAADVKSALKYMPQDFTTIVHMDMDHMRKAPLFQMVKQMAGESAGPELSEFQKATGFDVFAHISGITVAGPDSLINGGEDFIVVIQARYNKAKIVNYIKKETGPGEFVEKSSPAGKYFEIDGEGAIAFLSGSIVIGPTTLFGKSMAAKRGKNLASTSLGKLAGKFKASKAGFMVSNSPQIKAQLGAEAPQFNDFVSGGMGVDLSGGGLKLAVLSNFASADSATELAKMLTQGIGEAAKDPAMKDMGLKPAIDKAKVAATGSSVSLNVALNKTELETVQEILMSQLQ